jgi:hypothetical protein
MHFDRLENLATPDVFFTLVDDALFRFNPEEAMLFLNQLISINYGTDYEHYAILMKAFIAFDKMNNRDMAINLYEEFLKKTNDVGSLRDFANTMLNELKSGKPLELIDIERGF